MASPLEDLDELLLKCRDDTAKNHIKESVLCYKSGAFRASIVVTWIAVVFDIIYKLKELTLAGDKAAASEYSKFEKIRKNHDISKLLHFEKTVLNIVCQLELISEIERKDLERIYEDRNRCAHPSLINEEEVFNPSAELARLHIVNAVNHLLQHPPAQGKVALERLWANVKSEYFPEEKEKIRLVFEKKGLIKPRKSLVRNFVVLLLKEFLGNNGRDYSFDLRIINSLLTLQDMQYETCIETFSSKLSDIMRSQEDEGFDRAAKLVLNHGKLWNFLDPDIKDRIEKFTNKMPSECLQLLGDCLDYEPLRNAAITRVNSLNKEEMQEICRRGCHEVVAEQIIEHFLGSSLTSEANAWAKLIIDGCWSLKAAHIRFLLENIKNNEQVLLSPEIPELIQTIRKEQKVSDSELDELLAAHQLSDYIERATFIPGIDEF